MKKIVLILLMLAIPWQAIASAERNLTHLLGSGSGKGMGFVSKHIAEHVAHIAHHHDDDDDDQEGDAASSGTHVDNSQKSLHHLADFEQGCNMNILLPAISELILPDLVRIAPVFRSDGFSDRTTIPLLRPPRALA